MIKANTIKYLSITFILIVANITLSMIKSQINERSNNRFHAQKSIEKSWTGDQTILASVLTVPYQKKVITRVFDKELDKYVEKIKWIKKSIFLLPKDLTLSAKLSHQTLAKGIYQVPVYNSELLIDGIFDLEKIESLAKNSQVKIMDSAYLSFGISDSRGVSGSPMLWINQQDNQVFSGSKLEFFPSGFHGKISIKDKKEAFDFKVKVQVKGMGRISFVATGNENKISVNSNWPHPSFNGAFLPTNREISDAGYSAQWKTGIFSTNIENTIEQCFKDQCTDLYDSSFGVNHIQSVDIYLKSLRSVKYGLLVVIITFTIFVLYEVLNKNIRIHPISYLLTGMALAIFFLLLVALSEHISFALSYWISSIACSGLIAYYVRYLSHSIRHGTSVLVLLNSFYLILFFIIRSEDHALLSGSILLFVLLATVIAVTKRVDWYQMGKKE